MKKNKRKLQLSRVAIKEYTETFKTIKNQIKKSQIKAALAANKELINLYWFIGKIITEKQKNSG